MPSKNRHGRGKPRLVLKDNKAPPPVPPRPNAQPRVNVPLPAPTELNFTKLEILQECIYGILGSSDETGMRAFLSQPFKSEIFVTPHFLHRLIPRNVLPIPYGRLVFIYAMIVEMMYQLFDPEFNRIDAIWMRDARDHRTFANACWLKDEERDVEDYKRACTLSGLAVLQCYERRISYGFAVIEVVNHAMKNKQSMDLQVDLPNLLALAGSEYQKQVFEHQTIVLQPYREQTARGDEYDIQVRDNEVFNRGWQKMQKYAREKEQAAAVLLAETLSASCVVSTPEAEEEFVLVDPSKKEADAKKEEEEIAALCVLYGADLTPSSVEGATPPATVQDSKALDEAF